MVYLNVANEIEPIKLTFILRKSNNEIQPSKRLGMLLKEIHIKKARKDHPCNACYWLTEAYSTSESLFANFDFTKDEKEAILKAERNGWKIKAGEPCVYVVGVWDDFSAFYHIDEIDDICIKYNFYDWE